MAARDVVAGLAPGALEGETRIRTARDVSGDAVFSVATPILHDGRVVGVVGVSSAAGEIDLLVRVEREQVLQMFVIAIIVSIGLSLVVASTIANPISELRHGVGALRTDRRDRTVRRRCRP